MFLFIDALVPDCQRNTAAMAFPVLLNRFASSVEHFLAGNELNLARLACKLST